MKPLTYGELLEQLQSLDLPPGAPVTLATMPQPLGIVQVARIVEMNGTAACYLVDSNEYVELLDGHVIFRKKPTTILGDFNLS